MLYDKLLQQPTNREFTKDECEKLVELKEVIERLNQNPDFLTFKKHFITDRRAELVQGFLPITVGSHDRAIMTEELATISNFEFFLLSSVQDGERAADYLKEIKDKEAEKMLGGE